MKRKAFGSYYQREVKASPIRIRGKNYIALSLDYDKELIGICKLIGADWNSRRRLWLLPNTAENFHKIMDAFKGEAWVDISELKAKQAERATNDKYHFEVKLSANSVRELDEFSRRMMVRRYSKSTLDTYLSILKRFFTYYRNEESVDLGDPEVVNYMKDVVLTNQYSEVYQRQLLGALKLFYKYVHGQEKDFSEVPRIKRSRSLPEVLSREEVLELFSACSNLKHEFCLKLIYGCGLRVGDAIGMRQRDIDLDRMVVHIKKGKGKKDRTVPFPRSLLDLYQRYLRQYQPKDYVLEGQYGGPYTATSVNNVIKKCCEIVGIKKRVSAHTLRHSFATHIISNGGNVYLLKEILGHESTKTTQIYVHLNDSDINSIENPLDRIMKDAEKGLDFRRNSNQNDQNRK